MILMALTKMLAEWKKTLVDCKAAHVTAADLNIPQLEALVERVKGMLR